MQRAARKRPWFVLRSPVARCDPVLPLALLQFPDPTAQLLNLRPLICQLSANALDLGQCPFQGGITWPAAFNPLIIIDGRRFAGAFV